MQQDIITVSENTSNECKITKNQKNDNINEKKNNSLACNNISQLNGNDQQITGEQKNYCSNGTQIEQQSIRYERREPQRNEQRQKTGERQDEYHQNNQRYNTERSDTDFQMRNPGGRVNPFSQKRFDSENDRNCGNLIGRDKTYRTNNVSRNRSQNIDNTDDKNEKKKNKDFNDSKPVHYIPPELPTNEDELFGQEIASGINFEKYNDIAVQVILVLLFKINLTL